MLAGSALLLSSGGPIVRGGLRGVVFRVDNALVTEFSVAESSCSFSFSYQRVWEGNQTGLRLLPLWGDLFKVFLTSVEFEFHVISTSFRGADSMIRWPRHRPGRNHHDME